MKFKTPNEFLNAEPRKLDDVIGEKEAELLLNNERASNEAPGETYYKVML